MLTFIQEVEKRKHVRMALYRCDCGRKAEKRIANVNSGGTNSCGLCKVERKHGYRKNQEQPWTPIANGIRKDPPPVPSFADVSQSQFKKVAAAPLWLIVVGGRVVDRQLMTLAERRTYA